MISRSTASAFPLSNAVYEPGESVIPTYTVPVLGNQGDMVVIHVNVTGASLVDAAPTVESITVAGAPGLEFGPLTNPLPYTNGFESNDVETWTATIPAGAAGAVNAVFTVNLTGDTQYYSITVDCFSSGLGAATAWIAEIFNTVFDPSSLNPPFVSLIAPSTEFEMAYIGYAVYTGVTATGGTTPIAGQTYVYNVTSAGNLTAFGAGLTPGATFQPIGNVPTASVAAVVAAIWLAYVPEEQTPALDQHLMDAEQVEINVLATPGPTSWQPPRDIQVNLLPVRQNLVADPVGRGGGYGWTLVGGTLTPSIDYGATPPGVAWPAETTTGYILTATSTSMVMTATIPANPLTNYSFSAYLEPGQAFRSCQLVLDFVDITNTVISSSASDFTEVSAEFVRAMVVNTQSPLNAVSLRIQIVISSTTFGEQHYVGAVLLEMSSFAGIYFDANFEPATDYIFEGSPNQSPSDYYPNLIAKLSRLAAVLEEYTPMGSTYSIFIGAEAMANAGLLD
jgi:hypothetical protein